MSKISARPWKVAHSIDATDSYRRYIEGNQGNRICSMYRKDFCDHSTCMPDAEYIVKCVNERDSLIAEIEKLWQHHLKLCVTIKENLKLKAEVERLKEYEFMYKELLK